MHPDTESCLGQLIGALVIVGVIAFLIWAVSDGTRSKTQCEDRGGTLTSAGCFRPDARIKIPND